MVLRSEWMPRPITLSKLHELEQAIDVIEHLLSNGENEAADERIRAFNETYGRSEDAALFQHYKGSVSRTELALRLSQPKAARSEEVKREELIELVRRIQDPEYALSAYAGTIVVNDLEQTKAGSVDDLTDSGLREPTQASISSGDQAAFLQEFYLDVLNANVSMPGLSDLIFWDDPEAEEIADRALAYRPIVLPPT